MSILVVYDSGFGNTKKVAEAVAEKIKGKAKQVDDVVESDLSDIDVLIVGSPINAWRPTKKVSSFLSDLKKMSLKDVKGAAFDTRIKTRFSGDAATRIARKMTEAGINIIGQPAGFYVKNNEGPLVEGEIDRAIDWAKKTIEQVNSERRDG